MMCREHVRPNMPCPNRCSGNDPLTTVKVQRAIQNQLDLIMVNCHMCDMAYALSERHHHFVKYCPNIRVEYCIFPDCKTYEEGNRADFESHLVTTCGSKFKQCTTCDLDVYKIYEDDVFREAAKGHLCERDCLLSLAECIIGGDQGEDDQDAALDISIPSFNGSTSHNTNTGNSFHESAADAIPGRDGYNYFGNTSFHRSLTIARKTLILQKIEY